MATDDKQRIAALEDEIGGLEDEIGGLRSALADDQYEIDGLRDLVQRMANHAEDYANTIERWKEAFAMEQNEDGKWSWGPFLRESLEYRFAADRLRKDYNELVVKHNDLARKWNRKMLGGQPVGRPLAASQAQIKQVLKLRAAGTSLRNIAEETGLGLNTVRTIIDKRDGAGRTARRRETLIRKMRDGGGWQAPEFEIERAPDARQKAIEFKRQKRTIDALPQQAQRVVEDGRDLVEEAKGLD